MQGTDPTGPTRPGNRMLIPLTIITLVLVALSDFLIFDVEPGLGLFLLTLSIALGIGAIAWRRGRPRRALAGFLSAAILAFPLVEAPSLPGLGLAALGLSIAALFAIRLLPGRLERLPGTLLRFLAPAPLTLARRASTIRFVAEPQIGRRLLLETIAWAVPIGLGLVFVMLFAAANPLIEAALSSLRAESALDLVQPVRLVFWLFMAAAIFALLQPSLLRRRKSRHGGDQAPPAEPAWLNQSAILRSLVLFNALFAVETVLDLAFLWGGLSLPEGVSHAEYAHRGAYPLIVTALLAAGFVLLAMRQDGPGQRSLLIRGLVYAFIGQNVLLCLSSILRLELYVEVYSLTQLRLAAGIWMGLVATGLILILLRIWWKRSNAWLIACNLIALALVFYGAALADLNGFIARFNVEHSQELTGEGMLADLDYLRSLGPAAIPAFDLLLASPGAAARHSAARSRRDDLVHEVIYRGGDWRSWSWRQQRLFDHVSDDRLAYGDPNRQNSATDPR